MGLLRRVPIILVLAILAVTATGASAGVSAQGVVTGRVMHDATKIQCVRAPCLEPAPGVRITFWRLGVPRSVVTDGQGRFRVLLPPGVYRVASPGLVRRSLLNLNAMRVRSGAHVLLGLRVAKPTM